MCFKPLFLLVIKLVGSLYLPSIFSFCLLGMSVGVPHCHRCCYCRYFTFSHSPIELFLKFYLVLFPFHRIANNFYLIGRKVIASCRLIKCHVQYTKYNTHIVYLMTIFVAVPYTNNALAHYCRYLKMWNLCAVCYRTHRLSCVFYCMQYMIEHVHNVDLW